MRPRILTEEQLEQIRAIIAARRAIPTHAELARRYGVSKRLVDDIACGVAYPDVPRGTGTNLPNEGVEVATLKP